MRIALATAIRATSGRLLDGTAAPSQVRLSTDTRAIVPGDTFLALQGDRFDGHDFTADAARRGAAMIVIQRHEARVAGVPALMVADTKSAYMALAGAARALFRGAVVGITGSVGKTTTKAFLAQLLSVKYGSRILSTAANENNEIGVGKLLLNASNDAHDVIVAEMGARHYGDIAPLVEMARPQVGILTNIGEAHLEIMGSRERLAETKWALFERGAEAILNADDAVSRDRAVSLFRAPHWFAARERPVDAGTIHPRLMPLTALLGDRLVTRAAHSIGDVPVDVRVAGVHNRANLAAAIVGALHFGVAVEELRPEIARLRLPEGRYARLEAAGGLRLIYDAYNANATGMIAALDAFGAEVASRRIAVLASMAELGDESNELHERVGAHAAGRVDVLIVRGDGATDLARGAQRGGLDTQQIVLVDSNAAAAQWLRQHARADDIVLLKGSRQYKLEEIVEELRA